MLNRTRTIVLVATCMLVVMALGSTAWAAGSSVADLIYDPGVGNVWMNARGAGGGIITSFQLENDAGTFRPGNYVGPTGGLFGGVFEEVTTKTIADTDYSWVGFSGTHNFGNIFPAGMSQPQLDAYLTTKVYTGALGTGQYDLDLKLIVPGDADIDGDVDVDDFMIVKTHMGTPSGADLTDGDFDFDSDVDWYDLQMFIGSLSAGGGAPGMAPEPATLGLLAIGAMAVIRRRRRS